MFPYRMGKDTLRVPNHALDAARSETLRIYLEKPNEMKLWLKAIR
jgi:hypothetical protein